MDEIGEACVGVKGIEPGSPGEPEQGPVPDPVSRFEAIERFVDLAKPRVDDRERGRRCLPLHTELLEFPEKPPGLVCPGKPAIDMPQVRD
jgi:hypothetical protein